MNPLFNYFILKKGLRWIQINGWDCCCPDASLDTKIGQIDLYQILMSYVYFDIIWHLMSYDAYDVKYMK